MKRSWVGRMIILAVIACLLLASTGCGKKEQPQPVTEETSESQTVTAGQLFTVTLESNQSTGYGWSLAQPLDASFVQFIGKDYVEPDASVVGAAGKEVWQFQAVGAGNTQIVLQYNRPWETGVPAAKIHTVDLSINQPTNEMSESVNIQAGQTFTLSLDADQSTGYSWGIVQQPDTNILKLVSQSYVPSGTQPGAPGKTVFVWQGLVAGNTTFVLQYQRPQETSVPPLKKDTVKVTVTPVPPPTPAVPKQYSDPKVPIKAAVGEVFIIVLPANASTGYSWQLLQAVDGNVLAFLGNEYREQPSAQTGVPGAAYITFEAKGKGSTVIYLGLMPPGGNTPSQTANFSVDVQ
jgi:inhibitor of cysteine peptidase